MERMTSWSEDCVQINGHALAYATKCELVQMAERLAAYEDEAERGRHITLPCVPGDTLWLSRLFYTQPNGPLSALVHAIRFDADGIMIVTGKRRFSAEAIGKTVFYTREEAERAMERQTWNG